MIILYYQLILNYYSACMLVEFLSMGGQDTHYTVQILLQSTMAASSYNKYS